MTNNQLPLNNQDEKTWFHKCMIKKNSMLAKLFYKKARMAHHFTSVGLNGWKTHFNTFAASCTFPGFLQASRMFKFNNYNKFVTFQPTMEGTSISGLIALSRPALHVTLGGRQHW